MYYLPAPGWVISLEWNWDEWDSDWISSFWKWGWGWLQSSGLWLGRAPHHHVRQLLVGVSPLMAHIPSVVFCCFWDPESSLCPLLYVPSLVLLWGRVTLPWPHSTQRASSERRASLRGESLWEYVSLRGEPVHFHSWPQTPGGLQNKTRKDLQVLLPFVTPFWSTARSSIHLCVGAWGLGRA